MDCAGVLETILKDTVFALRTMRKRPAFSATAIFTLALGIGGTTAMFTVIRGVLLRPLEYRDPDGLVRLSETEFPQHPFLTTPVSGVEGSSAVFQRRRGVLAYAGECDAIRSRRPGGAHGSTCLGRFSVNSWCRTPGRA